MPPPITLLAHHMGPNQLDLTSSLHKEGHDVTADEELCQPFSFDDRVLFAVG